MKMKELIGLEQPAQTRHRRPSKLFFILPSRQQVLNPPPSAHPEHAGHAPDLFSPAWSRRPALRPRCPRIAPARSGVCGVYSALGLLGLANPNRPRSRRRRRRRPQPPGTPLPPLPQPNPFPPCWVLDCVKPTKRPLPQSPSLVKTPLFFFHAMVMGKRRVWGRGCLASTRFEPGMIGQHGTGRAGGGTPSPPKQSRRELVL